MQDTISYFNSSKRYAGKRFLLHSWKDIQKMYISQPQFHKNGVVSLTSMKSSIEEKNKDKDILTDNRQIRWHKWQTVEGKTAPQKCEVKGTVRKALVDFVSLVDF